MACLCFTHGAFMGYSWGISWILFGVTPGHSWGIVWIPFDPGANLTVILSLSSFCSFSNLIFESEKLRGTQKCIPLSSRTSRSA